MRVTAGEISKMVQAAMLVEGPTSIARDSGRRGGGDSERTMDRWAHAAANGGLDREKRQSASWNQSDDVRMRSIGKKVGRDVGALISNMLEDSWHSMALLTKQELATAQKAGYDEVREAIATSPALEKSISAIAKWIMSSNDHVGEE